jgi:long-chain acyl-CoA synthetase
MVAIARTPSNVAELLLRGAAQTPDAVCLIDPESGRTLTFRELRDRVASFASQLDAAGLKPGQRICVVLENGIAAVVSQLGIMGGGFIAVPIDPGGGAARIGGVLDHCRASAVVVGSERRAQIADVIAGLDRDLPLLHPDEAATGIEPGKALARPVCAADDALLMYTSGTTARPKGVLLSHADLMHRAAVLVEPHGLTTADRLLCVLPLYHMNAQNMILAVLYSGGVIVMPQRFQLARYWNWAIHQHCTWLSLTPALVAQLVRAGVEHTHPQPEDLQHVRFARCSSAPLSKDLHRAFEARFGVVLAQGMGMSEAGTMFLNPPYREGRRIGSIGKAFAHTVKVVDGNGREVPNGEVGEILVRGPGVVRGYYQDPEATAAAFAEGWLRTGDLGYRDADGYFFHLGRVKDLIIKAGTNIAPNELDEALEAHPAVVRAAAVGVPDSILGEDVAAFVVRRSGMACSEKDLIEHCVQRLGELKAPSWIAFVPSLPLTATGKVQRAVLARQAATRQRRHDGGAAPPMTERRSLPETEVERAVAAAWVRVLGCAPPRLDDDFFALGGTSLFALRIMAQLRRDLGVPLSLGAMLRAPRLWEQARLVERRLTQPAEWEGDPQPLAAQDCTATLLTPGEVPSTAPPLFCFYDFARFTNLAARLAPEHPLYGLSIGAAIDAVGGVQPVSTFTQYRIEDLARLCVRELRRVQPHGPYQLAGFSFGGKIALEAAQQLQADGHEVRLLVIVDTFLKGAHRRRPLPWLMFQLRRIVQRGSIRRRGDSLGDDHGLGEPTAMDQRAMTAYREAAFRSSLTRRYQPRPYRGDILLFRGTRSLIPPHLRLDATLGWQRVARGRLLVHHIEAGHFEILDEHAAAVADVLRNHLSRHRGGETASDASARRHLGPQDLGPAGFV